MKKRSSVLALLVILMLMALGVGQALAASGLSFDVTESSVDSGGYYSLSFTADTDYTDIREFAVGNNDAGTVWVDGEASHSSSVLTDGFIARKNESGHWQVWKSGGYRDLTWLDNVTGFDSYTKAFLYTSWGYNDSGYSGYLETGFTNGYEGSTQQPSSPFAAYSASNVTITGETSAVPIPGALWLLGSGLFGLVTVRRRKKS